MKKKQISFLTSLLLLNLLFFQSSLFISSSNEIINPTHSILYPKYYYTEHPVIRIFNDTELSSKAVGGFGTLEEPYILEGWNITHPVDTAIRIEHTTKHFIIRNCWIKTSELGWGIWLYNISANTATVRNNYAIGGPSGIYAHSASNITVESNTCYNNIYNGISIRECIGAKIENNTCYLNRNGIDIGYSDYSEIIRNEVFENRNGISLDSNFSRISENKCYDNDNIGIIMFGAIESEITFNNISRNHNYGVILDILTRDNEIHHNYLYDNNPSGTSQAFDSEANNTWYQITRSEGNYWNNYNGTGFYQIDGPYNKFDLYPLDIDKPKFTILPLDEVYEYGSTNNNLIWIATDFNPSTYHIYVGFKLQEEGFWQNSSLIVFNVDGFDIGVYIVLIIIHDSFGNFALDDVTVSVLATISEFRKTPYFLISLIALMTILFKIVRRRK